MAAGDPSLTLPPAEQVTPNSSTGITGIGYHDSFAAANPGFMYLSVTDELGALSATDSSGKLGGAGVHTITLSASYADITAVLQSLAYTAPGSGGSDRISFDIWDQAGIETTGSIPVTIAAASGKSETWTGSVSSDWNTAANWSGNAVPTSGDTVNIAGGTPNNATLTNATLSGETITLSGSAAVNFSNVTLDSLLQVSNSGSLDIGGMLTIGSHGTLQPAQGAALFVNTAGSAVPIVNNGVIRALAGSLLTINNGGTAVGSILTVQNNGIIAADGGDISFDFAPPPFGKAPPETLINSGSIAIANGGALTLNGSFTGNNVAFNGKGALGLQVGNAFAGGAGVTGFGPGDQIDLYGVARGVPLGFSNGILSAGTSSAIPLTGSYGLGNFESESIGGTGNPQIIAYAPDGGPSGVVEPDIAAPATATVAQGTTLSLANVSISGLGTASNILNISVGSGTLYMDGATGSGTNHVSVSSGTPAQIAADLASLAYVPAAGATADTVLIGVNPPAPVQSTRSIPVTITITSGGAGPGLHEPLSETVAAGATVAVSGSYNDSFAQHNPGMLFIGISDGSGTLRATDASGHAVAGSGSHSIGVSTDYADASAILKSLTYTAGGAGQDAISFDIWNQAGIETTGTVPVTVTAIKAAALNTPVVPQLMVAGAPALLLEQQPMAWVKLILGH